VHASHSQPRRIRKRVPAAHALLRPIRATRAMRKQNQQTQPSRGKNFFPFEEDLVHHIDEALAICSTGVGLSFFDNPFVRNWLRRLEPRHRPIFRLKLMRSIRCIQDVLQSEVRVQNCVM
jgi:hypothetical protein